MRLTPSPTVEALSRRGLRRRRPTEGGPVIFTPPASGPGEKANARRHAQVFILGFVVTILVGAALLSLPWVTTSGERTPVVDALFTSVSATSTTGLGVVDTLEHWNWWGEVVVLMLVQAGGLGFSVGASILLQMLRRGTSAYTLRDELLLKDGAPALSVQEAVSLGGRIIRFTLVAEAVGAVALAAWFVVASRMGPLEALWNGVFYAVAAFCNGGFDLTRGVQSVRPAEADAWINVVVMVLAQAGSLSYIVLADVGRKRSWWALALDSKIVLAMNGALLLGGVLVFLAAEWGGALATLTPGAKVLAAGFQSVAARTAGFTTIDWNLVHPLTLFFWLGLMFIGGAAGSTAGGVGLNTVGVVVAAVSSTLRGNPETQVWGRRIATPLIFRAVTVIAMFLLVYGIATVALSIAEHHLANRATGMMDVMFETMSALSTTGISTGITPTLTTAGKLVLCATMFVGRLGPLTAVYALQRRQRPERYRFPEEAVRIG
jgi:trk system potassium uptake protein TrkH